MLLSIVIPAYNEEKLLPASLAAIRQSAETALTPAGIAFEIIVCNNNSTDRTAAVAEEAGARVVFEAVNQIGRARNAGAAAATGEWILFVDADSHPSAAVLTDLTACLRDPQCIGGGCLLEMDAPIGNARAVLGLWHGISRLCRWAAGAFLFVRTDAFRECGGFAGDLYASEEIDLSRKLKRLGRTRGQRMVILTKHRVTTSARKMSLYNTREHLRFVLRALCTGGASLRKRDTCEIWYDGRR